MNPDRAHDKFVNLKSGKMYSEMDNIEFKKYLVNPNKCYLKVGNYVTPGTVIGLHCETGQPVVAEIHGEVVTIYHNPVKDTVMMLAVLKNNGC